MDTAAHGVIQAAVPGEDAGELVLMEEGADKELNGNYDFLRRIIRVE